ncbi:MAG TPA: phosphatase PAP2 family protein [Stellaceae bacterium]|nr:phosphatase PAP2 family protein [Stellaceae bacterium]
MLFRHVDWQRLSVLSLAWFALIVLAYLYLDRPIAWFVHDHLRDPFIMGIGGPAVFESLTNVATAMEPLSIIGIACLGAAILSGWRRKPWTRLLLAAAIATVVADVTKNELKLAFGRAWPETWYHDNPSLIVNGVYGFFPFHGDIGWGSFPSGHTTLIATPMAVLWFARPHLRWVSVLLTGLVIFGLIGLNYHFLSDCMAGLWLGTVVGGAAAVLFGLTERQQPRASLQPADTPATGTPARVSEPN